MAQGGTVSGMWSDMVKGSNTCISKRGNHISEMTPEAITKIKYDDDYQIKAGFVKLSLKISPVIVEPEPE
jgi:hypothetical protein